MKKLMETVDGTGRRSTTETVLKEGNLMHNYAAQDAAEELEAIGHKIEEIIEEAKDVLQNIGQEGRGAAMRAEAYWIPHILGAVALSHQSSSMTTLSDTIEELNGLYQDQDEYMDDLDADEDEVDEAIDIDSAVEEDFGDEAFLESNEGHRR